MREHVGIGPPEPDGEAAVRSRLALEQSASQLPRLVGMTAMPMPGEKAMSVSITKISGPKSDSSRRTRVCTARVRIRPPVPSASWRVSRCRENPASPITSR
ncbi:hypothetical protein GCM10018966_051980 [Streptomyces yanii]